MCASVDALRGQSWSPAAEGGSAPGSPVACVVATLERSIKPKLKSAGRVHLQGPVSVIARRLCPGR